MPHKKRAAGMSNRLAETAARAGAVNTLVRVAGEVVGHNTDIAGIRAAWTQARLPAESPVLILGAGGAAAAALLALEGHRVSISSRRPQAAAATLARLGIVAVQVPWGEALPDAVVVNATPLGMKGEELEERVLDTAEGLFDMAYGSAQTPAVRRMIRDGLPAADGRLMLLHQAAAAFELWTGRVAPLSAMEAALAAATEVGS